VGNMLEHTCGPLKAGLAMMAVPFNGNFEETASNEFSEESGMRVFAVTENYDCVKNGILALSSFALAKKLASLAKTPPAGLKPEQMNEYVRLYAKQWNKLSRFLASTGVTFGLYALDGFFVIPYVLRQKMGY